MSKKFPAVSPKMHREFCETDGWELLNNARGSGGRDHFYYEKRLENGQKLLTKISHNNKEYGPNLWAKVWKKELGIESQDQFFEVLRNKKPLERNVENIQTVEASPLEPWLERSLIDIAGIAKEDLIGMSPDEAQGLWMVYCGMEQTMPDMNLDSPAYDAPGVQRDRILGQDQKQASYNR